MEDNRTFLEKQDARILAAVANDPSLADLHPDEIIARMKEQSSRSDFVLGRGVNLEREAWKRSQDGIRTMTVRFHGEEREHATAVRDSIARCGFRCTPILDNAFEMSWDLFDCTNHETGEVIKNVMRFGKNWVQEL